MAIPPILSEKRYEAPSVFTAQNLLREARRQKSLAKVAVPRICVLDPDGDIVRYLTATNQAQLEKNWACYHTRLYTFVRHNCPIGIIGCAVGASFAVLVAEELFASGCELLISITCAGQITALGEPPYFILIEQALRDEGTSYHYLPPISYATLNADLRALLADAFTASPVPMYRGASWTTDAPFRETATAIEYALAEGLLAVEMEAAALYAFAQARVQRVVCFAHVTNQMGRIEGDFEKGNEDGSQDALQIIARTASVWAAAQAPSATGHN